MRNILIKIVRSLFSSFIIVFLLQACSSVPERQSTKSTTNNSSTVNVTQLTDSEKQLYTLLYAEYNTWKGTPYKLGGTSFSGVDCSAFVQNVYADSLSVTLPRTTKQQIVAGKKVSRSQLKIADLVFFKTSWKVRHVGIYIGDNQFLHASTSKGVIISKLDNVYWEKSYWQARRILK